jgi:hypothetical protein
MLNANHKKTLRTVCSELRNGYLRTFEPQEVSDKIAEMLSSPEIKAEVKIIFQTVEDLHIACPKHLGLVLHRRLSYQEEIESLTELS